tara:strand:- start:484 stop:1137 length:654 start_codon:yes stop_codon:yes gene_type:complete
MCISEEVSWTTLIVGTITNIVCISLLYPNLFKKNNSKYIYAIVFIILWQYGLLMQIPDGIAWRQIKDNKSTKSSGILAFILNVTQPIIFFIGIIILMIIFKKNLYYLIPALILLIYYIYQIIHELLLNNLKFDVSPKNNCKSLNYQWWEKISSTIYLILFPLIIIPLFNLPITILNLSIFFISLIISSFIVYDCNPGSLWCWSIAIAGLINYLFIYF